MAFNGKEGGQISLTSAAEMTAEYRAQNPGKTKGHFYGKDALNELLDQTGCMGIRIYYAIDSSGKKELVLVGVDSNEDDMLNMIVDISSPCPNRCSQNNALNS